MTREVAHGMSSNVAQPEQSAYEFIDGIGDYKLRFREPPRKLEPQWHFPVDSLLQRHENMVGNIPLWRIHFDRSGQRTFIDRDIWQAQRATLPTVWISPSTFEKTLYFLYSKYALSSVENPYVYPDDTSADQSYREIKGELMHESDALFGAIIQGVTDPQLVNESLPYRYGKTKDLRAHLHAVFDQVAGLSLPTFDRNGDGVREVIEQTRVTLFEMWKRFYRAWVPTTFPNLAWAQDVPPDYVSTLFRDANILATAWARAYVGAHAHERMLYVDQNDTSPLYRLRTRRALRAQVHLNPYPYFNHVLVSGEFDGLTIFSRKNKYALQVDEFKSRLFKIPKNGIEHDILMRQLMLYGLIAQGIMDPMYDFSVGKNQQKPVDESGVYWGSFHQKTTDRPTTVILRMLDRNNAQFVTHMLNVNEYRKDMIRWLHWFVAAYEAHYDEVSQLASR